MESFKHMHKIRKYIEEKIIYVNLTLKWAETNGCIDTVRPICNVRKILLEEIDSFVLNVFTHTHVNNGHNKDDSCRTCGLDLREGIHKRIEKTEERGYELNRE